MKKLITLLILATPFWLYVQSLTAQDIIFSLDFTSKNQTIRHFGASDAWSVVNIGKKWPLAKKEDIAKHLFSKGFNEQGNPEGIGLSMWRFRIGDGSLEQTKSGFDPNSWYTETDCFLNADGTYDWNKQEGSRWFLAKAKEYNVESFTGWTDSPPYFMTKNGYVFKTDEDFTYNLAPEKYSDFGSFLGNVAKHFQDQGYNFEVISPINEPQFSWYAEVGKANQSGSSCTNEEESAVVKAIDQKFTELGVSSKIMLTEAADIKYLNKISDKPHADNQVYEFWSSGSANFVGDLDNIGDMVSSHSYWSNNTVAASIGYRNKLRDKIASVGEALQLDLEYWQTEYSILGEDYLSGRDVATLKPIDYSLWIARIIHFDLTEGNCSSWSFWTAINYPKWADHKHRFGLINWYPETNDTSNSNGLYEVHKNLWALGNFSRFIRPGMVRISSERSDGLSSIDAAGKQMVSAYLGSDTLVVVAINYSDDEQNIKLDLSSLHDSLMVDVFKPYITSSNYNLEALTEINADGVFKLPAKSIVTFVGGIKNNPDYTGINETGQETNRESILKVYSNPDTESIVVEVDAANNGIVDMYDYTGKKIGSYRLVNKKAIIDLRDINQGYYIFKTRVNTKVAIQRFTVIK